MQLFYSYFQKDFREERKRPEKYIDIEEEEDDEKENTCIHAHQRHALWHFDELRRKRKQQ